MEIGLIWAEARGGVIGHAGGMPWHIPEDLAHFRDVTRGHPVLMGRKTWDALPPRFRPLPGRTNLVVTRRPDWSAPGASRTPSVAAALDWCRHSGADQAWVIGGGEVFASAVDFATRAEVTEIDAEIAGDTHAPRLGPEWQETASRRLTSAQGLPLRFVTWLRAQPERNPANRTTMTHMRAARFKVGDHVRWNSEAGPVSGHIIHVHTAELLWTGYTHHASEADPQYEIRSDRTTHVALHRGQALRLVDD